MYENICKIAHTFENANGIPCMTIDLSSKDELENRRSNHFCNDCAKWQMANNEYLQCVGLHKYATYQAKRWGGKYEYLCPAGLAFIAASVSEVAYGLVAGPFLMIDHDEYIEGFMESFFETPIPENIVKNAALLPYTECSRVKYIADSLLIMTRFACEQNDFKMLESFESAAEKDSKHADSVKEITTYIRSNYMNKLSLNEIANYVNFSTSYLCTIFKEATGENLNTFINQVRVENSKKMLMGNTPLVEISYMCGFEHPSYFCKVFKKFTGVTPGRFREMRGVKNDAGEEETN